MSQKEINIFWFRRDLRLDDNCGLYHALIENLPITSESGKYLRNPEGTWFASGGKIW